MSTLWGPPGNLRLLVLDIETCVAPGGSHRIVSIGVVVCRAGVPGKRHYWLVRPGVPVDDVTVTKHRLTDEVLAEEPTFDLVLPELAPLFVQTPGETLVIAAHPPGFDVHWLRSEIARVGGAPLPDLPLLDTSGPLARLAGVQVAGRSLAELLEAVGVENRRPHDALADAEATAEAACILLEAAEALGHADLALLLGALKAGTVGTLKARSLPSASQVILAPPLPVAHVATHANSLPAKPTQAERDQWRDWILECAELRCAGLVGRIELSPPDLHREVLLDALSAAAASGEAAKTATVLGALLPLLGNLPTTIAALRGPGRGLPRIPGQSGRRGAALALCLWMEATLAAIDRCPPTGAPCPSCREGQPCPRDTWQLALAGSVLGSSTNEATNYWNTRSVSASVAAKGSGRGYLAVRRVSVALADAGLRQCIAAWRAAGDRRTAEQVADQTWQAGSRDPLIAEIRALVAARGGRPADLQAAVAICASVLGTRADSSDPAWESLAVREAQIGGRLSRLANPTVRRHHPTNPKRAPRAARFLRAAL